MAIRSNALQEFLDSLKENFAAAESDSRVSPAVDALFASLSRPAPAGLEHPRRLPACQHLPDAINLAKSASPELARLARTFEAIEPALAWMVRASGGPFASANWPEGHANATIVGSASALEIRDDIAIGASLLAPNVRYPDHSHAPEEVYLLLTPGRFQHGRSDWMAMAPGETLYNEPHIKHAMASGDETLLAFWCLLMQV
jgi:quercetin dioxygenase-like cupin family protein